MRKKKLKKYLLTLIVCTGLSNILKAQDQIIQGTLRDQETSEALRFVNVHILGTNIAAPTDAQGRFKLNIPSAHKNGKLVATCIGYESDTVALEPKKQVYYIGLRPHSGNLREVVISGTMKEVSKSDSPIPVEVYSAQFFKANPTPTIFDALQNVNGVRPQLNCNICNTGDIHINGLEGPYTMILIDGMPIVSGLSTVYGLSGIPQSLIERVEIVKGPASTLYGSEAVGGLINIITKKPANAPIFSAELFASTWGEINTDISGKFKAGKNAQSLIGVNYFNYSNPIDHNQDGFTDVTLQNRISVFNKWNFDRKNHRIFSMAGRYVYEDRWGGEMNWNKQFRGGDSIYGESIYTKRWETFGIYQLPFKEKILFQFSANGHDQNSVYGKIPFIAKQYIGFGQFIWYKQIKRHDLLVGSTYRFTYYDDNTPATASYDTVGSAGNMPSKTHLPGIFVQDEIKLNENNKVLLGVRYDYNSIHGNIFTPRLNYKWNSKSKKDVLRFSIGNGYRVANIFTEDHAASTGSRKVELLEDLNPETSWNGNLNYVKKVSIKNGMVMGFDATTFYTYFNNRIIANYDLDPNKIIYENLDGHAISKGIVLNMDISMNNGLRFLVGGTYMDVYSVKNRIWMRQLFTEHYTGTWSIGYTFSQIGLIIDYTGNLYGPMRLPLLSATDPRSAYSPWWSIQNIQITKKFKRGFDIYCGIKNLLNWTPNKGNPFIIARSNDPFDKNVQFGADGQALVTPNNPYGLTFDPAYVYGPNQGIRGFVGFRYAFNE